MSLRQWRTRNSVKVCGSNRGFRTEELIRMSWLDLRINTSNSASSEMSAQYLLQPLLIYNLYTSKPTFVCLIAGNDIKSNTNISMRGFDLPRHQFSHGAADKKGRVLLIFNSHVVRTWCQDWFCTVSYYLSDWYSSCLSNVHEHLPPVNQVGSS